ncbi:MAG: restriction endonuclease [Moheibacter sp.]
MSKKSKRLHQIYYSEEYTRSYEIRYVAEIRHSGLNTYRIIRDKYEWLLENKIDAQFEKWDEQWEKVVLKNEAQFEKEENLNLALEKTNEAHEKLKEIDDILLHTLGIDDSIDWDSLKNKRKFKELNPKNKLNKELKKIITPPKPVYEDLPEKPRKEIFQPKFSFLDTLLKAKKLKKIEKSEESYKKAVSLWEMEANKIKNRNESIENEYSHTLKIIENQKITIEKEFDSLEKEWIKKKENYLIEQKEHNDKIEEKKNLYLQKDKNAILQYCELVLYNSEYPDSFPKDFELEYNPENNLLIIEYILPAPEDFPKLSEVKYIITRKELKEYFISDTQLSKMYDRAIYNICLRTLHEIFEADKVDAIDLIVFNGWVETINKATGKKEINCIVSLQATKEEFIQIELANVDPKACFKSLKGVGSSKLFGITAVKPLVQMNRNDKRFVESYEVANSIDEGFNLAAMDWMDFEHLIRELFEKEFKENGGEVKVTQASRDGGVDAVAFDPDPIRGGKIVIQAKRYVNTVGVSAVRDLYGTVMNEGAIKGILVSTADYGPDAYEFAKNKPLTLLNGNNLLYLLEKHGQKARIDLVEARKINSGLL